MDLDWIAAYTEVVRQGGFTEAADALFVSQSVISKQIRRMEKELNVALFDRSKRRAVLTQAGQKIYPEALRLLEQYHCLQMAACANTSLKIVLLPVADCYNFPKLLADFEAAYPAVSLSLLEKSNASVPKLLDSGQCDGAFYRLPDGADMPLDSICLASDRMVLLTAKNADLPAEPSELKNWSNYKFLLLDEGTGLLKSSLRLCQQAGFHPSACYIGASEQNIGQMVMQGGNIALLVERVAEHMLKPGLQIIPISPTAHSQIIFAPAPSHISSPAMQLFLSFLRNYEKKQITH